MQLDPTIFRAYDIRGIVGRNLTEDVVRVIGRAYAAEARETGQSRVAVGYDGRHSSPSLKEALSSGLTAGGLNVIDTGLVPTPLLYFATHELDTGAGVMITGSHNPSEYNGLKMMLGGKALAGDAIAKLKTRIDEGAFSQGEGPIDEGASSRGEGPIDKSVFTRAEGRADRSAAGEPTGSVDKSASSFGKGRLDRTDITRRYIDRILGDVKIAHPPKVVVDCGNGVAGGVAPQLLRELGCEVIELYCDIDGDFPNHHPDPADPANLVDLLAAVQSEGADCGLAFDGDGDRIGLVTSGGRIVWPDVLMMLLAQDIVTRNPGAGIVYDVKCSHRLGALVRRLGGEPIMSRTGHSHIKAKISETGALLGGEFSGHICFSERWYGFDDALYSAARLLEILGASEAQNGSIDAMFDQFPETSSTPELKIRTTETRKFEIIAALARKADFGDGALTAIDGLRVDYHDGWGLIRASNTSPMLTLRFEADGEPALERIQRTFQAQLDAIDPELRFL